MRKPFFPHDYKIYLLSVLLFVALTFLLPRTAKFNYDYKKGSPWMYETLIAQFDFPILKTDSQLSEERAAAGSNVVPYYNFSEDVVSSTVKAIETAPLGDLSDLKPNIESIVSRIYLSGVISDIDEITGKASAVIYIQKDKRSTKYPVAEVYSVSEARAALVSELGKLDLTCDVDSLCRYSGIYDLIVPNLLYDQETTDLVHAQAVDYISPTSGVMTMGQVIVSHGEIVTAEIQQYLDSYKVEYESSLGYNGPIFLLWTGNTLIALSLVVIFFFTILYTNPGIFRDFNRYAYLAVIYFITALLAVLVEKTGHQNIYLVPFSLMALYMIAFFKRKVVFPVYVASLLPLLIFVSGGTELFVMYLMAGVVSIFAFDYFNRGWQQFVTAFFVFLTLSVTFLMFRLTDGIRGFNDYRDILYMALGSLLSVAGYPLIYLFERVFMLVSNSRLRELSDTSNKLLLDLAQKAPGTFQHSLQVMNMADALARAIDANVELVRCGALYHDIGKCANPMCFIENMPAGVNYHDGLAPRESAKLIIKHVSDGLVYANKANLPEVIKKFILTHHGTTCTAYFYDQYLKQGGDPDDVDDFYYKGEKPKTKEQSILMLCDTVEAASRSVRDFSPESVSQFVENMCASKTDTGEFEEADISLKELNIVKSVLKDYILQSHHGRVAYPKDNPPERKQGV